MEKLTQHVLNRMWIIKGGILLALLGPVVDLADIFISIFPPTTTPGKVWVYVLLLLGGGWWFCMSLGKEREIDVKLRKCFILAGFGLFAVAVANVNSITINLFLLRVLADCTAAILFLMAFLEARSVQAADQP